MGGSLLAIYLARRNFDVEIYELRNNIASLPCLSAKSINQSLSARGIAALKEVQLWDVIKNIASPEHGRVIHEPSGELLYQPYGDTQGYTEWSINRNELNRALQEQFHRYPITIINEEKCVSVDFDTRVIELENQYTKKRTTKKVELVVGADGIHSVVRKSLEKKQVCNTRFEYLDWGYKNIFVPVPHNDTILFRTDAFHLWSKKKAAIFGMSNSGGNFTCTITLPLVGPDSFASIDSTESLLSFFERHFPDLSASVPAIAEDFLSQPATPFASVYADTWYYKDFCVLLGDACHAVTIFYGQGINAAFEDCAVLAQCIDNAYPNMEQAFSSFQTLRKTDTDVLADVCKDRFIELKDKYESPLFLARSYVFMWLERLFPGTFHSLYTLIVHSTLSYSVAVQRNNTGKRIARLCGVDILILVCVLWIMARKTAYRLLEKVNNLKRLYVSGFQKLAKSTLRKY